MSAPSSPPPSNPDLDAMLARVLGKETAAGPTTGDPTAGESPSLRLSLNWQQRHALLSEELARIERACLLASTLEGNGDAAQDALVERMRLDAAASDDLVGFHFDAGARSMAWGLVRVARLRSPFIESLLTSYNDFRRRDAFPAALA